MHTQSFKKIETIILIHTDLEVIAREHSHFEGLRARTERLSTNVYAWVHSGDEIIHCNVNGLWPDQWAMAPTSAIDSSYVRFLQLILRLFEMASLINTIPLLL